MAKSESNDKPKALPSRGEREQQLAVVRAELVQQAADAENHTPGMRRIPRRELGADGKPASNPRLRRKNAQPE